MLILYVVSKYDYGKPEQGYSFEHYNFYDTLRNMGHDILYFDFMTLMQQHSQVWMNQRLREVVRSEKPALMFTVLFGDQLDPTIVNEISQNTDTTTFNWFTDDHWRFDNFSYRWAPHFNWVATTANSALPKYERLGYKHVIKSQWACNPFLYRKLDLPMTYDVTFIGQPHGDRRLVIQALRDAGIDIRVWGTGWDTGRVTQDMMIRIFNQSRINLNLSNASTPNPTGLKYVIRRLIAQTLNRTRVGQQFKTSAKALLFKARGYRNLSQSTNQIKGRNFEVPGCGGMLLTSPAENLEQYYKIGDEIDCFDSMDSLIERIHYYLNHERERSTLAEAGYRRTIQDHSYVYRFTEIFQRMGLLEQSETAAPRPSQPQPGYSQDIQ